MPTGGYPSYRRNEAIVVAKELLRAMELEILHRAMHGPALATAEIQGYIGQLRDFKRRYPALPPGFCESIDWRITDMESLVPS